MKYKTDLQRVRDKAWELLECLREVQGDTEFSKTIITLAPGSAEYMAYVESVDNSCEMFIERVGYIHRVIGKWIEAAPGKRKKAPPPRPEAKVPKIKPKVAKSKVDGIRKRKT